ncbi:not available (plasmid) [Bacillus cereus]|nr:not available [Bacillus cereus]
MAIKISVKKLDKQPEVTPSCAPVGMCG